MGTTGQQLSITLRKLLKAPLFSAVAILTLAVGIGSNAAIFSVVNAVLLKPLPFKDPERLVGIWHKAPGLGFEEVNQSPALHFTYAAESHPANQGVVRAARPKTRAADDHQHVLPPPCTPAVVPSPPLCGPKAECLCCCRGDPAARHTARELLPQSPLKLSGLGSGAPICVQRSSRGLVEPTLAEELAEEVVRGHCRIALSRAALTLRLAVARVGPTSARMDRPVGLGKLQTRGRPGAVTAVSL
jgi:hypothetical protein